MTAKKLPAFGTRVAVFQIDGVTWPGKNEGVPLRGVVTMVNPSATPAWHAFYFMPDAPDPSVNDAGFKADEYNPPYGWLVYNAQRWKREQFVINELELT